MTGEAYETRAVLKPEAARSLLILMGRDAKGTGLTHRLAWTLFPDDGEMKRDFLYRVVAERPLTLVARSARRPDNASGFWELETRPFAPRLEAGQELAFRLSVSPSVSIKKGQAHGTRGRRYYDLLLWHHRAQPEERRLSIGEIADCVAYKWLEDQGEAGGFALRGEPNFAVLSYQKLSLDREPRPRDRRKKRLGVLDLEGLLTVTDPALFQARLLSGFGRGRGFGLGLMQIAPPRFYRRLEAA